MKTAPLPRTSSSRQRGALTRKHSSGKHPTMQPPPRTQIRRRRRRWQRRLRTDPTSHSDGGRRQSFCLLPFHIAGVSILRFPNGFVQAGVNAESSTTIRPAARMGRRVVHGMSGSKIRTIPRTASSAPRIVSHTARAVREHLVDLHGEFPAVRPHPSAIDVISLGPVSVRNLSPCDRDSRRRPLYPRVIQPSFRTRLCRRIASIRSGSCPSTGP